MGKNRPSPVTRETSRSSDQFSQNQFQNQFGSQGLDPASQAFVDFQRELARQGAGVALTAPTFAGPNAGMLAALQALQRGAGQTAAAQGQLSQLAAGIVDPAQFQASLATFQDPFEQQVIGGVRGEFDRLRQQASREAGDAAQRAGAFGGSRQAVTEGARLGALDAAQSSQIGSLLSGGFENAVQNALALRGQTLSGLGGIGGGIGAAGNNAFQQQQQLFQNFEHLRQLQQQGFQDPVNRIQNALGFATSGLGPTGSQFSNFSTGGQSGTSSGTDARTLTAPRPRGNALGGALGGAQVGAGFGPLGAVIGGGLGALGGLLGK